ncbi:MAG: hypothetical protein AAGJ40_02905 [Planctomycetota bacterium]
MSEIVTFEESDARMILRTAQYLRANGFEIRGGSKDPRNKHSRWPIRVLNASGETIPPFACMQCVNTAERDDQNYVEVAKPADSTGAAGPYVFNLFHEIPPGEYGVASDGPLTRAIGAATRGGVGMQPKVDTWELEAGGNRYLSVGPDDIQVENSTGNVIKVMRNGGSGGLGQMIRFEVTHASYASADGNRCSDKLEDAPATVDAKVLAIECPGDSTVGVGDTVQVTDELGCFLADREAAEIDGKQGYAVCMSSAGEYGGASGKWEIVFMEWWRTVQVVTDFIVGENRITVERKNIRVWDDCDLPDEIIDGVDCQDGYGEG